MLNYKLKIGIIPNRRYLPGPKRLGMFNPDYAIDNKNKVVKYIKETFSDSITEFVDLDFLNEEGILYRIDQCQTVCDKFKQEQVDAVIMINCNFGNEEAVGKIAQMLNLPVLLWGPRDNIFNDEGIRFTDTQCGLFAASKQLRRYGIKFSYIKNCNIGDEALQKGIEQFLSVVTMIKNFKMLRIVQVGVRTKPFKCVMSNELELTEKFGIDVVPINLMEATARLKEIYEKEDLTEDIKDLKDKVDVEKLDDDALKRMLSFKKFYKELLQENYAGVISTECWTAMGQVIGAMPCLAMSLLADENIFITCESDIYGAITTMLLASASRGKATPFFGEFTCVNPEDENSELLWHCGVFPYSLRKENGEKAKLYNAKPSWQIKDGEYTICRFQGDAGKYNLLGGKFTTTTGPKTFGTYLWAKFNDLAKVERKLIEGPYIHHMSEIAGDYTGALKEFTKFVPELIFDDLEK